LAHEEKKKSTNVAKPTQCVKIINENKQQSTTQHLFDYHHGIKTIMLHSSTSISFKCFLCNWIQGPNFTGF